ncbi:hypothetical protein [Runella sp. SP2]|uniref:hypothetical protein n=1 Tax=Runella sp. SP2 TaxID=2268026 RepID=UPI000F07F10E|nr:hypothetical protein [Runella sp. SP2]AYQ31968.1 hypothetical protein DTQ70_07185 [Runella sp. SP2]
MSLQKGTVVYAKFDGIKVYQEPKKEAAVWQRTVTGKKKAYYDWLKGSRIGTATGQMVNTADGVFVEVTCELVWWRKRVIDWVRENKTGYLLIPDDSFYYFVGLSDPQGDAPVNTPVSDTPNTGTGTGNANTGNGGNGGTNNTNTILWVVVAVLALVAGFVGFRKFSKRRK